MSLTHILSVPSDLRFRCPSLFQTHSHTHTPLVCLAVFDISGIKSTTINREAIKIAAFFLCIAVKSIGNDGAKKKKYNMSMLRNFQSPLVGFRQF